MSIDTVTTFFALLTIVVQLALVGFVVSLVSPRARTEVRAAIGPFARVGATAVAITATLGSLYFSEVAHFTPCRLCWYQRIPMYSSALVLAGALLHRARSGDRARRGVARHVRNLVRGACVVGALISVYHVLIERFPNLESSTCDPNNPCSLKWVDKFGYVTIPVMALSAFILIISLLTVSKED
jgi:disulfide bond formation protein DsbB